MTNEDTDSWPINHARECVSAHGGSLRSNQSMVDYSHDIRVMIVPEGIPCQVSSYWLLDRAECDLGGLLFSNILNRIF